MKTFWDTLYLLIWLIPCIYSISHPCHHALPCVALTVPILSNSHASSPFHWDDLLTLLGLWLPMTSGWRWTLTLLGQVGATTMCGHPSYLSQMPTLSSWLLWLTVSPFLWRRCPRILEVGSSDTFRIELFRKGKKEKEWKVKEEEKEK